MVERATPDAALVAATRHCKKRASTTVDHKTRDVAHPEGATARPVCYKAGCQPLSKEAFVSNRYLPDVTRRMRAAIHESAVCEIERL